MAKTKKKQFPRPRARQIPLNLVVDFLKKKGYTIVKIEKPWRHVVAIIEKNNKHLFFKMATTIKTGKMTKNEFKWNELVSSKLNPQAPFLVPQNIESGLFQEKLFFFISEYFGDQTLADKYPPTPKQLSKWIPKIAQATYLISQIKCQPKEKSKPKTIAESLIGSASEWALQIKVDVQPLLTIIKNSKQPAKKCLNHGDFVPWHMYQLKNNKFGLVDAEHGGCGLRYYDVAYFYVRIRQSLGREDIAKNFLQAFMDLLPKNDQLVFWRDLKPILSQRLIGDFWGAEIGPKSKRGSELARCKEFKRDLVRNKILS